MDGMVYMKKILKNLLIFILIITVTISLFIYTMLDTTKTLFQKDNIVNMLKQVDIMELIGEESLNQIYQTLEETGMPKEYADYVLKNDELKGYVSNYVVEATDYLIYDKELPKLNEKETEQILISSFQQTINVAQENNIDVNQYLSQQDQDEIIDKIKEYTPQIVSQIPKAENIIQNKLKNNSEYQETLKQIQSTIDEIQKIYSYQSFVLILIIIQFVLIVLLNIKKCFKNVAIPFFLNATLLLMINMILPNLINHYYPIELQFVRSTFDVIINQLIQKWSQTENLYFILFILLIVIQIITTHFLKKKKVVE